MAHGVVRATS